MPLILPRSVRRALVTPVALLLTITVVAAACGSSKSTTQATIAPASGADTSHLPTDGTPKDGGSLAWGLEGESDSLNPVTGRWALSGHMVGSAIFDSLAALDADPAFPEALPVGLLEDALELLPAAGVLLPAHADSALTSATAAAASSTSFVPVFQVTWTHTLVFSVVVVPTAGETHGPDGMVAAILKRRRTAGRRRRQDPARCTRNRSNVRPPRPSPP